MIANDWRRYGFWLAPEDGLTKSSHSPVFALKRSGVECVCSCGLSHFVEHSTLRHESSRALRRSFVLHREHINENVVALRPQEWEN